MTKLVRPEFWLDMEEAEPEGYYVYEAEIGLVDWETDEEFIVIVCVLGVGFDSAFAEVRKEILAHWDKKDYGVSILSITQTGQHLFLPDDA